MARSCPTTPRLPAAPTGKGCSAYSGWKHPPTRPASPNAKKVLPRPAGPIAKKVRLRPACPIAKKIRPTGPTGFPSDVPATSGPKPRLRSGARNKAAHAARNDPIRVISAEDGREVSDNDIDYPLRDDNDLFRALALQRLFYRIESQNGSLNIGISC